MVGGSNPEKWTLRKLVQNTYYHDTSKFKGLALSPSVVRIRVEHRTVYDSADANTVRKGVPRSMYVIRTVVADEKPVYSIDSKGKQVVTGKFYGECEIRLSSLSVDDADISLVMGNGKVIDLGSAGNYPVSLKTGQRLTPSQLKVLRSGEWCETFLLDTPLLALVRYLVDEGILHGTGA